jgi:hypothetical protein
LVALGVAVLVLGLNSCALSAYYCFQHGRKIYQAYQASGLANIQAGDFLLTLTLLAMFFAGWRTCTNGKRLIDTGIAPDEDKIRTLLALKTWKRSEKVGSPSLRFLTFILPIWFNGIFALGTYGVFTLDSPVGGQVLLHYLSMTFMGMALATTSWSYSRFEGVDLRAPENAELLVARGPVQPQSKTRGFLLRLLGIWAGMLGLLMMVDAFVLGYHAQTATTTGWRIFYSLYAISLIYFGLGVLTAGKSLLRYSRRHLARLVSSPEILCGESFALYLRPFRNDALQSAVQQDRLAGLPVNNFFTSGRSEEEHVAVALKHIGPMVAVGMPGEQLPHVGALRMYLPRDGWHEPVRELISQARLVILMLGSSEGTRWELYEAMRILAPQQLVLLVPMAAHEYESFRESVAAELRTLPAGKISGTVTGLSRSLPDYRSVRPSPSAIKAMIHFAPDWTPRFVPLGPLPFRLSTYRNVLLADLRTALRPVFDQLSGYEREQSRLIRR